MVRFNLNNDKIRYRRRIAVMVLPFALLLLSFVLLGFISLWLCSWFGIDPNAPFQEQPNSLTMLVVTLSLMAILIVVSSYIGWFLNGIILRFVFNWPTEKVVRFLIYKETPPDWLEDNSDPQSDTDEPQESEDDKC